jgi:hypothetical protein
MKAIIKRAACICAITALTMLASSGRSEAIQIEYNAGQDGLHLTYRISFLTSGAVDLNSPNDPPQIIKIKIFFVKLAEIQLSIASINPDAAPPNLMVHYVFTPARFFSRFLPTTLSGDITAFFGDAGLKIKLLGKRMQQTAGGYDAEAAILMTKKQTQYVLDLDLTERKGHWEGTATPANNQITETLTYQGFNFGELNLTFGYASAFFTKVTYTVKTTAGTPDDPGAEKVTQGSITLPNGSYHFWYNKVQ